MKSHCDACGGDKIYTIYDLPRIPTFQNRLFSTQDAAMKAQVAQVQLSACPDCGLVFNAKFDNQAMDYDGDYQNAQDHSPSFRSYLDEIADMILSQLKKTDKVAEVGCGKGFFLSLLHERGVDAVGFDPTYEGDAPYVTKEYFNAQTANGLQVDAIIMRHTLEHIEEPYQFLKNMTEFLPPDTKIFIEVPRFEWIAEHNAFWDIFHEHCNYFTEEFFRGVFNGQVDIKPTFHGQYMLVRAEIGDLMARIPARQHPRYDDVFSKTIPQYRAALLKSKRNFVWGAGAKGVAFVNLLDPDRKHVEAVIDINARKQNHFISLTGHGCVAPEKIDWAALTAEDHLWIMNGNYKQEILASLPTLKCQLTVLGEE